MRELENVVQRALILAPAEVIEPEHLLFAAGPAAAPAAPHAEAQPPVAPPVAQPVGATPANMRDLERQHILETLASVGGSRKKAVELLGISERTLRYKLAQYREEGALPPEDKPR